VSMSLVSIYHHGNARYALHVNEPAMGVLNVRFHCVSFHALVTTTPVGKLIIYNV